jgi:single-stranded-DNA-specific exonuclease
LSSSSKRWNILPALTASQRVAFKDLHPVLAQVLFNRGISDYDSAQAFLLGQSVVHDPFKMKGMSQALARIRHALRHKERIVIYGDFDADGVTSTVLLVQTLEALGGNVAHYIPHRVDEGYGLNTPALLNLKKEGVDLVITVDCGVRSVEEVKAASEAGLDIIVTDHHSIGDVIPPALAVINPKQEDCRYPEDMLAGVGIAYKLAEALIKAEIANNRNVPNITADELLDLVALGTVADLAPLDRMENRTLVRKGLQVLKRAQRPGIFALLNVAGIDPEKVDATTIGFTLGPRINAAGRLESATDAYKLLYTKNFDEAMRLAERLQEINLNRQDITIQTQAEARELAIAEGGTNLPLVFAAAPHFRSGIVGLVAGRLVEEFYRPAVVIEEGADESRGSCRSIPEFNITEALDECADLLLRHGGHAQAAGFSIETRNIPAFKERLLKIAAERMQDVALEPTLTVDGEISVAQASIDLAQDLGQLQPTGHNNSAPVFASRRLKVAEARPVGKEGKHLKLRLTEGPLVLDGIAFSQGYWAEKIPAYVDVAYNLEVNEWNGSIKPQANVQDIKPAE